MTLPNQPSPQYLQAFLFSIAIARSFDRQDIQATAKFIQHKCRQRFTINIIGNNHNIFFAG
jgi:hypothetical protein